MSDNGLWNDTATGFERVFALDGFFNEWTTLRNEKIRVVGRSCTILPGIEVKSRYTSDFLNEMFTITTTTDFTITETCKDDNANLVTREWLISNTTTISLPVTCTIKSEFIFCGYQDIVGSHEEHIPIEPARMEVIPDIHANEDMVKISDNEWTLNPIEAPEESSFSLADWTFPAFRGSSAGVVVIILLMVFAWLLYKQFKGQSSSNGDVVVKNNIVVNTAGDTSTQSNIYPALEPEKFELNDTNMQGKQEPSVIITEETVEPVAIIEEPCKQMAIELEIPTAPAAVPVKRQPGANLNARSTSGCIRR